MLLSVIFDLFSRSKGQPKKVECEPLESIWSSCYVFQENDLVTLNFGRDHYLIGRDATAYLSEPLV